MPRTAARLLLLAWTLVLVGAMLTPAQQLPEATLLTYDKLIHLAAFGLWTGLAWFALPDQHRRWRRVLLGAFLLAVLTEAAQGAFPRLNRSAELADAAADLLGAGLALVMLTSAQPRRAV